MRDAATLIARVLSGGRRRQVELVADGETPPRTDLRTIVVPASLTYATDHTLTVALGLQASPTKELVAALPWLDERRGVRAALAQVEGEHAVRWLCRAWPGLAVSCGELFDAQLLARHVATPTEPEQLLQEARDRAGILSAPPPPFLFGTLPPPQAGRRLKRTNIGSRLSDRRRLARKGILSMPASGPDGAAVNHPGEAGQIEALVGRTRGVGIPYDEWDLFTSSYRRDYAWVQERATGPVSPLEPGERLPRPRFTPGRTVTRGTESGEIDIDAVIAWRCALAAGEARDDARLFTQLAPAQRTTAFALLLDVSASSLQAGARSFATGLVQANALAATLTAAGHMVGAFAFRSTSHELVELLTLQAFGALYAPFGGELKPSGYTRFGAAIRHAGTRLLEQPADGHVLICLGDAVPSDEGYDGPYGRADVQRAARELIARGVVFRHLVPRERTGEDLDEMFGAHGWLAADSNDALTVALAQIAEEVRECAGHSPGGSCPSRFAGANLGRINR